MVLKEHYALSNTQLSYLSGQITLSSGIESTEKIRMLKKAQQAWSILIPILRSDVINQNFKNRILLEKSDEEITYDVEDFFRYLVRTTSDEPFEEVQSKIEFANMMIKHGFTFFQTRFGTNRLVSDKIEDIKTVLSDLQQMVEQEIQNKESLEMYRMRKKLSAPPVIRPDEYWKAECIHCYSYSTKITKKEKEAIENIQHDVNCSYKTRMSKAKKRKDSGSIKAIILQYIKTIPPIKK